ncbi:flavin reductase family protein [Clostridium botulinum]|uniref:flavin reductase family protein n=1 Tax=Clostridium botulinum TaxID=1491 RepID=UPI000467E196|nr:flavin reductase family protein [Clostridium botulinum]APR01235.1 flavoredoxin [Clostridium botulinum]APU59723.1 flavoredoxin [Clostridium botulinum]OSA82963.1 flavin reductase [Clostridium botulinum]BDB00750.1 flavodoxin [Clostridium botulinum]
MKKIKLQNRPFGPFPTILVGADVNGKPNYVTVGACGVVSLKPVLYVSLKDSHYTTLGIKENGYFSVNIPSTDLVQKTDYCGIVSGHKTDKSNLFTSFYDERGKAPMAEECTMNFLCKVIQTIPVFDFQMFLGEIEAVYINEECMTDDKPDPLKINPLIMMDSNYYDLGKTVGTLFKTGLEILPK